MTREAIYEKLNEVFQDVFDDDSITVNAETTADDIEDWDSLEHINLVSAVEKEFGISALNKDGVNLGMEIIKTKYLEKTGLLWSDIKDLRSPCPNLCLKDIIFNYLLEKGMH